MHYRSKVIEAYVRKMIEETGETMANIITPYGRFRLSKHYIALHGVAATDLPKLAARGIAEVVE